MQIDKPRDQQAESWIAVSWLWARGPWMTRSNSQACFTFQSPTTGPRLEKASFCSATEATRYMHVHADGAVETRAHEALCRIFDVDRGALWQKWAGNNNASPPRLASSYCTLASSRLGLALCLPCPIWGGEVMHLYQAPKRHCQSRPLLRPIGGGPCTSRASPPLHSRRRPLHEPLMVCLGPSHFLI